MTTRFSTVEEYMGSLPGHVQMILTEIRARILAVLPDAVETISYQIPTFTLHGKNLVHVAAWKSHIALYPVPEADEALGAELAPYLSGKGTLRFPLAEPIPFALIEKVAVLLASQRG
jgi:uncharacterized protein YdhG (YjbR/CyaY superfamily)